MGPVSGVPWLKGQQLPPGTTGAEHKMKVLEPLCMFPFFWSWDNSSSTNGSIQTGPEATVV